MKEKIFEQLKNGLVFLSLPYSSKIEGVSEQRYESALRLINYLMINEVHVISPIITGHPVVERFDTPGNWEYWSKYCEKCIKSCDYVLVYQLDGYDSSVGVEGELIIAKKLGKKIYFIDEDFNLMETLGNVEAGTTYGDFPIDEVRDYSIELWARILKETENIEEVKRLMQISAEAIELNKSLNWE